MDIYELHANSYSMLTDYYADLSEPMFAIRKQVLQVVLNGWHENLKINTIGPLAISEQGPPALNTDASILDIGCANGDNLLVMQQLGFKNLSGIDIAPSMVELAKQRINIPVDCCNILEYQGPKADLVFAQALVHLFPKTDLFAILQKLLDISNKRLYFSTTLHDSASEGLERKQTVERYRSRYTLNEILELMRSFVQTISSGSDTYRMFYFLLQDPLGKNWINVVIDKINIEQEYVKSGVLRYPGLFNSDIAEELNLTLQNLADTKAPPNTWMRYDDGALFDRVENFIPYLAANKANLFQEPWYLKLLAKLLGSEAKLLKDKCIFKPPGKTAFPLHQDAGAGWVERGFGPQHLTIAISLEPANAQNGMLFFAPGLHKSGLYSPVKHPIPEHFLTEWQFDPVPMLPGDAVIFDSYVPHYSLPNTSEVSRKIFFLTYIPLAVNTNSKEFFAEKRLREPPIDDRDSNSKMQRDEFGKWFIYSD